MKLTAKQLMLSVVVMVVALGAVIAEAVAPRRDKAQVPDKPDFAFPQQVERQALQELAAAERAGQPAAAVSAVTRYALAKAEVNTDSVPGVLRFIAEARRRQTAPQARALLSLLTARIYADAYQADSYRYNQRGAVAEPSEDFTEWGRQEFLTRVRSLVAEAMADTAALAATPVGEYAAALDTEEFRPAERLCFPTLLTVVADNGAELLNQFSSYSPGVLNPELMERPADRSLWPDNPSSPDCAIMECHAAVAGAFAPTSAPYVANEIAWLDFLNDRVFNADANSRNAALLREFRAHPDGVYAADYLLAMNVEIENDEEETATPSQEAQPIDAPAYYRLLEDYAEAHPDFPSIEVLRSRLQQLAAPALSVRVPGVAVPGEPFEVTVSAVNTPRVTLRLYDVTALATNFSSESINLDKKALAQARLVDTVAVRLYRAVPFAAKATATLTLPRDGRYVVLPSATGTKSGDHWTPVIAGTSLLGGSLSATDRTEAWVVNPLTGQPQPDATLVFQPWSNKSLPATLPGMTDRDGSLTLQLGKDRRGQLRPQRGSDRFSPAWSVSVNEPDGDTWTQGVQATTSLGLYHPGDAVDFAAVVYQTMRGRNRLAAEGTRLQAVLRDANWQAVDTLSLATDTWGRAEGRFTLPTEGLTGRFSIELTPQTPDGPGGRRGTSVYFEVADYKLPTFYVEVDSVTPPERPGEPAVIAGRAQTFAQFPVEDARVEGAVRVRVSPWPWSATSPQFATAATATDAQGRFRLEIPAGVITSSPAPRGVFLVDLAVTSASGETQAAKARFNMGKPLTITASIPSAVNASEPVKASVAVTDAAGNPVEGARVGYTFTGRVPGVEKPVVRRGTAAVGEIASVVASLPEADYTGEFTNDDALPLQGVSFAVYRPGADVCPVDRPLWLPKHDLVADSAGVCAVVYGSALTDAAVMAVLTDANGRWLRSELLRPRRGMNAWAVAVPHGQDGVTVSMRCVSRYKSYTESVNIMSLAATASLRLEIETFRDRVSPGDEEQITLRVSPSQPQPTGADVRSALIVDMANRAIDRLAPNPIDFRAPRPWLERPFSLGLPSGSDLVRAYPTARSGDAWWTLPQAPSLNLYGRSFYGDRFGSRGFASPRMMLKSAAAPMMANGMMADMAAPEAATVMETSDDGLASETAAGAAEVEKETAPTYRPCEIPLAFFRPMLTTDAGGRLTISYRVPDANTSWVLRALSYNSHLLAATTEAEVVASKPLMVSTNAPRFVRCGDHAALPALVMNATDSTVTARVTWQVLATGTEKHLAEHTDELTLAPRGSQEVSHEVDVTGIEASLTFRVRAVTTTTACGTTHTDGEQTLLPVLPAMQQVVESEMFYIAPRQAQFSLPLEGRPQGSRTLLNFTENPTWQVVTALPGLREGKISSSLEASASLFAACVAEGLLRQYPETARALRRWAANPQDSMLVSNLQKNKELQQMFLSSTPWVEAAMTDTERLQRLALLLDPRQTRQAASAALDRLAATACSGGGWGWTASFPEYSQWVTTEILFTLGTLDRLGWLPQDARLRRQIDGALTRLDRETADQFRRRPGGSYLWYAYLRSLWPSVRQSSASKRVSDAAVQRCIDTWRDGSVADKAVSALLLSRSGYRATASQILASLRQLATTSPQKGMWWQQLDPLSFGSLDRVCLTALLLEAFAAVEPQSPDVDLIRQWLVLQKANTDWGAPAVTTRVVAAILTSGSRWTTNPAGTAVRVGQTLLHPSTVLETGSFTENISPLVGAATTLTIDRQADYPSFGAVVTMRRDDMSALKAVGCAEARIEKRYSVFRHGRWEDAAEFATGERVRVTLTVHADTDFDYAVISDARPAGLAPAEQLSGWEEAEDGTMFYRENRTSQTHLFRPSLRRGTTVVAYELFAAQPGVYSAGAASLSSAYNPLIAAHSTGATITIR